MGEKNSGESITRLPCGSSHEPGTRGTYGADARERPDDEYSLWANRDTYAREPLGEPLGGRAQCSPPCKIERRFEEQERSRRPKKIAHSCQTERSGTACSGGEAGLANWQSSRLPRQGLCVRPVYLWRPPLLRPHHTGRLTTRPRLRMGVLATSLTVQEWNGRLLPAGLICGCKSPCNASFRSQLRDYAENAHAIASSARPGVQTGANCKECVACGASAKRFPPLSRAR